MNIEIIKNENGQACVRITDTPHWDNRLVIQDRIAGTETIYQDVEGPLIPFTLVTHGLVSDGGQPANIEIGAFESTVFATSEITALLGEGGDAYLTD